MARTRRDLTTPENPYALSVHREPGDPAGIAAPNLDGYHGAYLPRRELDARPAIPHSPDLGHRALEPARGTVPDLERGHEPGHRLPHRAVGLDHRPGPAGRRDRLRTPDHRPGAGPAAGRAAARHRHLRTPGADQHRGGPAGAGHEPTHA